MIVRFALAFAALAAATPAQADMTATYVPAKAGTVHNIQVEIADNGDVRADMFDEGTTLIRHLGRTYLVMIKGKSPVVVDTAALAAVIARQGRGLCPAGKAIPPVPRYVRRGTATIRGRTGDAWYRQAADG